MWPVKMLTRAESELISRSSSLVYAPCFHTWGLDNGKGWTMQVGGRTRGGVNGYRFQDWREMEQKNMLHFNDKVRFRAGLGVLRYFGRLYKLPTEGKPFTDDFKSEGNAYARQMRTVKTDKAQERASTTDRAQARASSSSSFSSSSATFSSTSGSTSSSSSTSANSSSSKEKSTDGYDTDSTSSSSSSSANSSSQKEMSTDGYDTDSSNSTWSCNTCVTREPGEIIDTDTDSKLSMYEEVMYESESEK